MQEMHNCRVVGVGSRYDFGEACALRRSVRLQVTRNNSRSRFHTIRI